MSTQIIPEFAFRQPLIAAGAGREQARLSSHPLFMQFHENFSPFAFGRHFHMDVERCTSIGCNTYNSTREQNLILAN